MHRSPPPSFRKDTSTATSFYSKNRFARSVRTSPNNKHLKGALHMASRCLLRHTKKAAPSPYQPAHASSTRITIEKDYTLLSPIHRTWNQPVFLRHLLDAKQPSSPALLGGSQRGPLWTRIYVYKCGLSECNYSAGWHSWHIARFSSKA